MIQDSPYLTDLDIPEVDSEDVTIFQGANVLEAKRQHGVQRGRPEQPVAILTTFGWTLAGSVISIVKPERLHVMHVHRVLNVEESLSKHVEDWWRTESFGTKYEDATPRSREAKRAPETLQRTVKHVFDRCEVRMLWREGEVKLITASWLKNDSTERVYRKETEA